MCRCCSDGWTPALSLNLHLVVGKIILVLLKLEIEGSVVRLVLALSKIDVCGWKGNVLVTVMIESEIKTCIKRAKAWSSTLFDIRDSQTIQLNSRWLLVLAPPLFPCRSLCRLPRALFPLTKICRTLRGRRRPYTIVVARARGKICA